MKRAEALEKFRDRHGSEKEELAHEFEGGIEQGVEEMMSRFFGAFGEIADQAQEQGKPLCVFFQFSLLRYDLLQDRARVRLDVMDASWVLDQASLCTEFDLSFLFAPYFRWREKLLKDMREYRGKVNQYDVERMVQEEVMSAAGTLTQVLRLLLRRIEEQEDFARIPKGPFWEIQFGEYRDYSEPIMRMNREPRNEEVWLEKIKDEEETPGRMQFSWWHKAELTGGNCLGKNLDYIVFEECSLEGIDFERAQMTGARFLNCRLKNCSFKQSNLTQAEFEHCQFTGCDFAEAALQQAVFSLEGLEAEWFDEKQQDEMLISGGMEE